MYRKPDRPPENGRLGVRESAGPRFQVLMRNPPRRKESAHSGIQVVSIPHRGGDGKEHSRIRPDEMDKMSQKGDHTPQIRFRPIEGIREEHRTRILAAGRKRIGRRYHRTMVGEVIGERLAGDPSDCQKSSQRKEIISMGRPT